jgi:uncharacterized protein (TIGR00251 family)
MSDARIESDGGNGVRVWVKAVPRSSRDQIAGVLGDRLKVRVSAPAEDGRANKAVCATIAKALGIKARQVTIESGHTSPEKIVRIEGVSVEDVRARFKRSVT